MRTRVYIAGPYSKGDPCENTNRACHVRDVPERAGYAPFCPHWSHFQHTTIPRPYAVWIANDFEWLRTCHVLLRLSGESAGADGEVREALKLGLPVYQDLEALYREVPATHDG